MEKINFHMHTIYSDGELNIFELLKLLERNNVSDVAITDHDTLKGYLNYQKISNHFNLNVIPAVEISTNYSGMHILGYGISNINFLQHKLDLLRITNLEYCKKMIELLYLNGIDICFDKVDKIKVYNEITKRDIVRYMVKMKYVGDYEEAYSKYIGKNCSSYIKIPKLDYRDAIGLIKNSGGIAVLAHPNSLQTNIDIDALFEELKEYGLQGIESITPKHRPDEVCYFRKLAKRHGLVETAGTDFHRLNQEDMFIGVQKEFLDSFYGILNSC